MSGPGRGKGLWEPREGCVPVSAAVAAEVDCLQPSSLREAGQGACERL